MMPVPLWGPAICGGLARDCTGSTNHYNTHLLQTGHMEHCCR